MTLQFSIITINRTRKRINTTIHRNHRSPRHSHISISSTLLRTRLPNPIILTTSSHITSNISPRTTFTTTRHSTLTVIMLSRFQSRTTPTRNKTFTSLNTNSQHRPTNTTNLTIRLPHIVTTTNRNRTHLTRRTTITRRLMTNTRKLTHNQFSNNNIQ